MRGGASDLYGSSAIGGVIDVVPVEPGESLQYALNLTERRRTRLSLVDSWPDLPRGGAGWVQLRCFAQEGTC
jgi:hypothetical protein